MEKPTFPEIDLFPRATKVANIARNAIRFTFEHIPTSDFGRTEHLSDSIPSSIPFEDEVEVLPSYWDSRGFPQYTDGGRWTEQGTYYEGEL